MHVDDEPDGAGLESSARVATAWSPVRSDPSPRAGKAGGSEISYTAVIEMKVAAKLAAPLVKLVFEKIGSDTEDDMTGAINKL